MVDYLYLKDSIYALKQNYNFLKIFSIGKSTLKNEIYCIKFGTGKKEVLYTAGIHANEWITSLLLIGVSGVGAKSAISMLSSITPSKFALAVISNDVKTLTKIPGIGPKSAQRIILELKDKLKTEEAIQTNSIELKTSIVENNKLEEAVQALKVLGYTRQEIESVLAKIEVNTLTVEDIIRKALSFLGM